MNRFVFVVISFIIQGALFSMDLYEKKYHIKETPSVKSFHASRRMFCIKDDQVYIAQANLDYSHAVWFEKEGWMTAQDDTFINTNVRGFVDKQGNIYFYVGYDFIVTSEVEKIFFDHLQELAQQLNLSQDAQIYGGLVRQSDGGEWPPAKSYGSVQKNNNT